MIHLPIHALLASIFQYLIDGNFENWDSWPGGIKEVTSKLGEAQIGTGISWKFQGTRRTIG